MLQSCEKKKTFSEIYLRQPHLQPLFVCVSLPGTSFVRTVLNDSNLNEFISCCNR